MPTPTPSSLIKIRPWQERLAPVFVALNREWIEHYFAIEPEDERLFANPEGEILRTGGEIWFAARCNQSQPAGDDDIVGTVAIIEHDAETDELAKMAVTPQSQGLGAGRALIEHVLHRARQRGKRRIVLATNTILAPAVTLYESVGFERLDTLSSPFARGNLDMELQLK